MTAGTHMKHRLFLVGIYWTCGLLPIVAYGQSPNPEADALFRSLDADGNGRLSMNEASDQNRRMFESLFQAVGKPATDVVTRSEFQTVFDRMRGGRSTPTNPGTPPTGRPSRPDLPQSPAAPAVTPATSDELPALLRRVDANGDGKISRTEWGRVSQMFSSLDLNKDGQLDAAEANAPPPADARGNSATRTGTAAAAGPAALAGTWRGWVVEGRGENPDAGQMQLELVVNGNTMRAREFGTNRIPEGGLGAGKFVLNGPGQLDALQTEGRNQGRNYPGIFEIQGDVLRWCVSNRPGERPAAMASVGASSYLLVLRRVRE